MDLRLFYAVNCYDWRTRLKATIGSMHPPIEQDSAPHQVLWPSIASVAQRIGEVVGVDYRVRSRIRNMAKCYKKGYAPIFVAMEVEMLGIIFQM